MFKSSHTSIVDGRQVERILAHVHGHRTCCMQVAISLLCYHVAPMVGCGKPRTRDLALL
jgi:hypothetical protein